MDGHALFSNGHENLHGSYNKLIARFHVDHGPFGYMGMQNSSFMHVAKIRIY